ncbi:hypothetical protein V2J09_014983 [Rumex salicifolius]
MSTTAGECSGSEIMLFGVRLVVDSMRKSVSLNNLSQYVHPQDPLVTGSAGDKDVTPGYASADDAGAVLHRSPSNSASAAIRDRKRGVPWTEEEHKLFLLGLQKVGKGDWRGISRNFVKTRTPTQVASHAQKYFLRRSNLNRRRRRSSLFDITTETVSATPAGDQHVNKNDTISQSPQENSSEISIVKFSATPTYPVASTPQVDQSMSERVPLVQDYMACDTESVTDKAMEDLDLNRSSMTDSSLLSLNLSLSLPSGESSIPRQSPFNAMPSFFTADSMISVG